MDFLFSPSLHIWTVILLYDTCYRERQWGTQKLVSFSSHFSIIFFYVLLLPLSMQNRSHNKYKDFHGSRLSRIAFSTRILELLTQQIDEEVIKKGQNNLERWGNWQVTGSRTLPRGHLAFLLYLTKEKIQASTDKIFLHLLNHPWLQSNSLRKSYLKNPGTWPAHNWTWVIWEN